MPADAILVKWRCIEHALRRLLWPHIFNAIGVNRKAAASFSLEGGLFTRGWRLTLKGVHTAYEHVAKHWELFNFQTPTESSTQSATSGRSATRCLSLYQDGLPFFDVIRKYVGAFIDLHYETDEDILADVDLRGFYTDLNDHLVNRDLPLVLHDQGRPRQRPRHLHLLRDRLPHARWHGPHRGGHPRCCAVGLLRRRETRPARLASRRDGLDVFYVHRDGVSNLADHRRHQFDRVEVWIQRKAVLHLAAAPARRRSLRRSEARRAHRLASCLRGQAQRVARRTGSQQEVRRGPDPAPRRNHGP
eukprot:scaffold15559_cov66-Phaeocystis_antarctica.AAC.2